MKLLNNSNTMHGLFIKKTIIENDPENLPSDNLNVGRRGRKWLRGGSGFPLNSDQRDGAGVQLPQAHAHTQREVVRVLLPW